MGSLCSKGSAVDKSPSDVTIGTGSCRDNEKVSSQSQLKSYGDLKGVLSGNSVGKRSLEQSFSFSEGMVTSLGCNRTDISASPRPALSRVLSEKSPSAKSKATAGGKSGTHKQVSEVSSLLGRAGTVGFGKAVEVLDTLGSSMTNLNINSGFSAGVATKGNQISILAFEVANTIVKGANFMQSLSAENIKHLKEVVLPSEAVQSIVSKDKNELLRIAAIDKREELKVFSGEIVRFGNRCRDPQWHNLDRYFAKLGLEITPQQQLKEQAAGVMQQLLTLVQYTAELYHELHAFDRFDQDYRRKVQEDENSGAGFQILRQELKSQGKHVKILKKKSLWSRNLEEVIEKLVDIVYFMHFEIHEAFESADGDKPVNCHQRLGPTGLALHYANIINQIDSLVSRSGSVPPNMRDSLYQNLPPTIKSALRWKLQEFQLDEEMTAIQIKAEMEKTLRWLVPIANNTTKVHHGFGWVGEWASTGAEVANKPGCNTNLLRIETLYHADKEITDAYILDLIVWLHHFINLSRRGKNFYYVRSPIKSPTRTSNLKCTSAALLLSSQPYPATNSTSVLTQDEQDMVVQAALNKRSYRRSKSQDFDMGRRKLLKNLRMCKSNSNSPMSASRNESSKLSFPAIDFESRNMLFHDIDFETNRLKALDVIDRVDSLRMLY